MRPEKFIVYSKPNCTYCEMSKSLLSSKGLVFEERIMDVGQPKLDGKVYVTRDEVLAAFPGARTMPQIMAIQGSMSSPVGGHAELTSLLKSLSD